MRLEGRTISQVKSDPELLDKLKLRRLSLMSDAMLLMNTHTAELSLSEAKLNSEKKKLENRFVHRTSLRYRRRLAETIAAKATTLSFTQNITSSRYVDGKEIISHRTEERKDVSWSERELVRRDMIGHALDTFDLELVMRVIRKEYKKNGMLFPEVRHGCDRNLFVKMPSDSVTNSIAKAFIHERQTERGYISYDRGYWELLQKMLTDWRIEGHGENDAPEGETS